MKFGPVAPDDALGGVAVHSIRKDGLVLKKGTVIGDKEAAALKEAGIVQIVVARLDAGDIGEDEAAADIAVAISGEGVTVAPATTGRANIFAAQAGVLVVDRDAVDAVNRIDEAITFATLPAFKSVVAGEMVATVKIVPFALPAPLRDKAVAAARKMPLKVVAFKLRKIGIVSTLLPGLATKVVEKTLQVTAGRLAPAGASILAEKRVPHDDKAVTTAIDELLKAGAELVLVFGASAIADRRDVIPSAIEAAGGSVDHFGMPVDPGNLMLIGRIGPVPVIGAPGCARSPKENGFDWILMRLLAGLPVDRTTVTGMGVGGLLMEIVTRPQPRVPTESTGARRVAAIVLAAGQSRRMGGPNKLLAELGGKALVRIVVEQALASKARPVLVVTGHMRKEVEAALAGLDVTFVPNDDFAKGLATSVKAGIAAVPDGVDGALVCLGDMPLVDAALLDKLIAAFAPDRGALVALPVSEGRRGNPVLWSRRLFSELLTLEGDAGARQLIDRHAELVAEVPVDGRGAFLDIDTPEALDAARRDK